MDREEEQKTFKQMKGLQRVQHTTHPQTLRLNRPPCTIYHKVWPSYSLKVLYYFATILCTRRYSLLCGPSFSSCRILGIQHLTKSLQSTLFQNAGRVWTWHMDIRTCNIGWTVLVYTLLSCSVYNFKKWYIENYFLHYCPLGQLYFPVRRTSSTRPGE